MKNSLFQFVLTLADDALILGHRLSEWAYRAPFLEEDIALSNISLDMFGRANMLLEYATNMQGQKATPDELAFKRNEREYYNHLLCEQPNGHFGETILRQFLFDSFYSLFLEELAKSSDIELSAIAKKSIKEVTYHFRHSSQWVIRLGAGTEESHNKMNMALNKLWQFTEEFFIMDEIDKKMLKKKIGVNRQALKSKWIKKVDDILKEATLEKPKDIHMLLGGKKGIHTEHLGHILSDMQYLQRAYPDAKW